MNKYFDPTVSVTHVVGGCNYVLGRHFHTLGWNAVVIVRIMTFQWFIKYCISLAKLQQYIYIRVVMELH